MMILSKIQTRDELQQIAGRLFGTMLKAVVDVERGLVAVDAELHSDLEAMLLENRSKQKDLWGINLYPEFSGDEFIEYDSMINIRPSQGNKTRGVDDEALRKKINTIVARWVKL